MLKSKIILSLLVVFALLIFYSDSLAVPAAPSPTCAINATVLDIKKTRKKIEVNVTLPYYRDYYAVRLKIHNSIVFRNEKYGSCDNLINTEKDSILPLSEYDKFPIKIGQEIYANIEFGGDERFGGYFLSDIKILK